MRFLVDENLPFSLIHLLQASNHDVVDIAASALRGFTGRPSLETCAPQIGSNVSSPRQGAADEHRILITKDLDFPLPNIRPYPSGLILIRVPDTFTGEQITRVFSKVLETTLLKDIEGQIVVVTPGQVRFRPLDK